MAFFPLMILFGLPLILIITNEFSTRTVYGRMLGEDELKIFLDKYLDKMELNQFNPRIMSHRFDPKNPAVGLDVPFMASHGHPFPSLRSKWHINDYGIISRKGEAHKRIEARHKELMEDFIPRIYDLSNV